jgi:hypothetical protein
MRVAIAYYLYLIILNRPITATTASPTSLMVIISGFVPISRLLGSRDISVVLT